MPQPLPAKEQNLFKSVVKFYEAKQYKKAIKSADQVLKKAPNHADTQAFKALTLEKQGHIDEAFALIKVALKNDMKSHICWHVYGLLYRAVKNVEEAVKAYKFALRLEPDSQQILRDLAYLQIQIRDYQGYIESRGLMVKSRPQVRQNWTGYAVAHHLAGNLQKAEELLTSYEDTLKGAPSRMDIEDSEARLYKNTVIAEQGDLQRALDHLDVIAKRNLDRTAVLEIRADYLLRLDRKEEAEKAYRVLIERNNEYRMYYEQLEKALGLDRSNAADVERLAELYKTFADKSERLDAARRIPLDFLSGEKFEQAADAYLRRMFNKGVPSTFANIKTLYIDSDKKAAIHKLVTGYLSESTPSANGSANGIDSTKPDTANRFLQNVHYFLAQHYNYHLSRDLSKAMEHIEHAIELDPKSVDYTMTKARIQKHYGNLQAASETMDAARKLDERDRYINTKCAKYQLRNDQNEEALSTMSKFTRNETVGGPLGDLHEMQCMWYLTEDGESYMRQGRLALALKRFTALADIFDTWHEDQFDFHSFSLRKGQVRAYVDMVRWEDHLRDHPFFTRIALKATKIYIMLYDDPSIAKNDGNVAVANGTSDGANGLDKKAQKKAQRDRERAEKAEQAKREDEAKKNPNKKTSDGETKKEDPDPKGLKLVQTDKPLEAVRRFLDPMLELSPKCVEAQCLGVEVFLRQKKPLLALKCIVAAHSVDPENPQLHEQIVRFRKYLDETPPATGSKEATVLDEVIKASPSVVPSSTDLKAWNESYLKKSTEKKDARCVLYAIKTGYLLDSSSKAKLETALTETTTWDRTSVADAQYGLEILRDFGSGKEVKDKYLDSARKRWPDATVFKSL